MWADVNTTLINGITLPSTPTGTYTGGTTVSHNGTNTAVVVDASGNAVMQASAPGYGSPTAANFTWTNAANGDADASWSTTGTSWDAPSGSLFVGSSAYTTNSNSHYVNFARRGNLRNNRTFAYRFTNCAGVSALVKSQGTTDGAAACLAVYKVSGGNLISAGSASSKTNAVDIVTVDGLTASETYVAFVYGMNGSNGELYEIAFLTPNAVGPSLTLTAPATDTNVAINTSVELTANEDITAVGSTIAGTIKAGDAEATAITFTRSGRVLTYTPATALSYNTTYVVKLNANQIQNGESEKNAEQSFTFTTMPTPVTTAEKHSAATGATLYANNSNATPALSGSGINSVSFAGVCTLNGDNMQNGSNPFTIGGNNYTSFKVAKKTYTIIPATGVEINSVKLYIKSNHDTNTVKVTTGTSTTETETANRAASAPTEIDLEKDAEGKFCFTVVNESAAGQAIIVLAINYDCVENIDVTVSSAEYATLFYDKNLTVPTGVTAYKASVSGSNIVLSEIGSIIPANTGVILKADAGKYNFVATTADASGVNTSGNILTGSATATSVSANSVYTLGQNSEGEIGLRQYSGTAIRAFCAYASSIAGARDFYGFSFEDETTGVNDVRSKKEDGRGEYFDLLGRKVAQPTKGLYIVNGKKVVIK